MLDIYIRIPSSVPLIRKRKPIKQKTMSNEKLQHAAKSDNIFFHKLPLRILRVLQKDENARLNHPSNRRNKISKLDDPF